MVHFRILVYFLFITAAYESNAYSKTPLTLVDIDPRIFGGSPISISQAPWQASIRLKSIDNALFGYGHICGGSVITQRVVVTAAHCIGNLEVSPVVLRSANEFTIVVGSSYLHTKTIETLQFNVLQVIVNEDFEFSTLRNDVALMFLDGRIPANYPTVIPIPLNRAALKNGTICTVTGWGRMENGKLSNTLMEADVPIVDRKTCIINYRSLAKGMLCAGYMRGGIDACQGDSGGPLQCNGVLGGIVSWGDGCAQRGFPGIYTNVSYYRDWINDNNAKFNYSFYGNKAAFAMRSFAAQQTYTTIAITVIIFVLRFVTEA